MKNTWITLISLMMLAGLISAGCDSKGKLLQERLNQTEKELEAARVSLNTLGEKADKVPALEAQVKQKQEEMDKLKADIDGARQDKDSAIKEKEEAVQKNTQLKTDNAKLNEEIKKLRAENEDLRRRIRELESAIKSMMK
ncbi:MAG TPA: hypothetical protein VJC37_07980 [Planctomycetota bacterium]|nr:hypothetical protein [Planctomycetota bacterium]